MLAPYRSVLSHAGMPRLLLSALCGRMPQGMSALAILLLVRGSTHSYAAAGAAVGAYALASAVVAPIQGRLIDQVGRSRVLAPVSVAQCVLLVLLVLSAHWGAGAGLLVLIAGLAGAMVPSIAPSVRALFREVVEEESVRETAYALESIVQEVVWILGPVLVALLVALTTPSVAILATAVICVSGTILFVRSPLAATRVSASDHDPPPPALTSSPLRLLLMPIALTGFALGSVEVGLPSLALHAGSRSSSGILLALWSLGSMIGGLWFGSRTWRWSLSARYTTLLVVAMALTAPLIVVRTIPTGALGALLAGLAIAPLFSCQYALVGRSVRAGAETEAFTWVTSALVIGIAAGSAGGGGLISSGGVAAPFELACVVTLGAALIALASRQRIVQLA